MILPDLSEADYRRLIRGLKRDIRVAERKVAILRANEERPMTKRQIRAWCIGIVLGHLVFVLAAFIYFSITR